MKDKDFNIVELDWGKANTHLIGVEIDKYIRHIIYVSAEDITENDIFMYNGTSYVCIFVEHDGEKYPIGISCIENGSEEKDMHIDAEELFSKKDRDVNTVVVINPAKGFKGFYILGNGRAVIDYYYTNDGRDEEEHTESFNINMN